MKAMTLQELYEFGNFHNIICVKSAYNGQILCKQFSPKKHAKIAEREVSSLWPKIQLLGRKGDHCQMSQAILCCYVNGREEYEREQMKKNGNENAS